MNDGVVEEPEVDPPTLKFSRVATDVEAPREGGALEILVQVWSDGSFTCATRSMSGAVRVWGAPSDMEAR